MPLERVRDLDMNHSLTGRGHPLVLVHGLGGGTANFAELTFYPAVPTMINAVINHPRAEELGLDVS